MTNTQAADSKSLILVPGFMSPSWMLIPIQHYLSRDFDQVIRWDYPRILNDTNVVTRSLAELFDSVDGPLSIIAHSFGDWITRSALHQTRRTKFERLVSVCPVTTTVPVVHWTKPLSARLASAFEVMSDAERASLPIPEHVTIRRTIIWSTAEFIVRKTAPVDPQVQQREVSATHNSILFQPNGWRAIRDALSEA